MPFPYLTLRTTSPRLPNDLLKIYLRRSVLPIRAHISKVNDAQSPVRALKSSTYSTTRRCARITRSRAKIASVLTKLIGTGAIFNPFSTRHGDQNELLRSSSSAVEKPLAAPSHPPCYRHRRNGSASRSPRQGRLSRRRACKVGRVGLSMSLR
jgi:hypothetical protein